MDSNLEQLKRMAEREYIFLQCSKAQFLEMHTGMVKYHNQHQLVWIIYSLLTEHWLYVFHKFYGLIANET